MRYCRIYSKGYLVNDATRPLAVMFEITLRVIVEAWKSRILPFDCWGSRLILPRNSVSTFSFETALMSIEAVNAQAPEFLECLTIRQTYLWLHFASRQKRSSPQWAICDYGNNTYIQFTQNNAYLCFLSYTSKIINVELLLDYWPCRLDSRSQYPRRLNWCEGANKRLV